MFVEYKGFKEELKITRAELCKSYKFGKDPVETTDEDGLFLTENFPTSFVAVPAPVKKKSQPQTKKGKAD